MNRPSNPRTAVLLGKGELAIEIGDWFLAAENWSLEAVVPVVPEPKWSRSFRDWALERGVTTVDSGNFCQLGPLHRPDWRADLALSVYYDRILGVDFIRRFDHCLNLHNAPLPRYRGVSPINWALKNGERLHGVTLHELTLEVDAGPIVSQVLFSIYPEFDEVRDVYARCLRFGWQLFLETIPLFDRISATPQDEARAITYRRSQDGLLGERRYFTKAESRDCGRDTNP